MNARDRLTSDHFDLFPATADGILRWVETTRPEPPRSAVIAHVRHLADDGVLAAEDVRRLAAAGYPVT